MSNWPGSWNQAFRAEIADRLFAVQGERCSCCGEAMDPAEREDRAGGGWSLEHVWPRGRYRYAHLGNITLAHQRCNVEKGERDPNEFEIEMLGIVNAEMGWTLRGDGMRNYVDLISAPSALAIAFATAQRRAVA